VAGDRGLTSAVLLLDVVMEVQREIVLLLRTRAPHLTRRGPHRSHWSNDWIGIITS
jgi:hypothetical protein